VTRRAKLNGDRIRLGAEVPADLYARSSRIYCGTDEPTYRFHDTTVT
jgi:hypothetical protein